MRKSAVFTTLAAAALALGLSACDEPTTPMQQQGAMPPPAESGTTPPTAPGSSQ